MDERAQHPATDGAYATILVCDDDPSLRELVRAVLGPRYRFVEAADGTEALALAREDRPDLVGRSRVVAAGSADLCRTLELALTA